MRAACLIFAMAVSAWAGQAEDDVPATLRVPADLHLILQAHGVGDQIYACVNTDGAYGWKLKTPDAQLFDSNHRLVGRHFGGPSWEATDKSTVVGKVVSSVQAPGGDSIPWLLLTVVKHAGDGVLARTTYIQRLHTRGGNAATSGCEASTLGREQRVHYEADYLFYGEH